MAGLDWLTARPVAHRGLHNADAGIIENTLSAAAAAIAGGYAIELDVQPDADLEPVVFHDDTLDRLTTGQGPVGGFTAADLATIPFRATDDRIPTLRAFLEFTAGRVPVVVEVKTDGTGMPDFCRRVADILSAARGPVAVMSFDPDSVAAMRTHAPGLPRGIVAESFRHPEESHIPYWDRFAMRHLLHCGRTKPQFIAYCVDDLPAAAPLALRWGLGLPLLTWTVRTPEQRERGKRWADQIIFEGFEA